MADTLTPSSNPGDQFTLEGRALVVRPDAKYWKHDALQVKCQVTINGQTRWADIRILDETARWFGDAAKVVEKLDAPADEQKPEPEKADADEPAKASSIEPTEATPLDSYTVRQLRALADRNGIAVPTSAKKAELLAIVRDALAVANAA